MTRVCPSICLSTPRGGYPGQVQLGGGGPQPGPGGGYLSQVQAGGFPTSSTPHRTWPGGGGTHIRPGWGGYPNKGGGVPHRVVLDTPRSVCLLRSRRRTFLFYLLWASYYVLFWFAIWARFAQSNGKRFLRVPPLRNSTVIPLQIFEEYCLCSFAKCEILFQLYILLFQLNIFYYSN